MMKKENRKEYFEELEKKSREITEEVVLEQDENGYICRAAFSTVRGETGIAFFETQIYDYWEDLQTLDIRIIPQFQIEESCLGEVRDMIEKMNPYLPLGMLGIIHESKHLFWRLSMPIAEEKNEKEYAAYTITIYQKIATIFGAMYEAMERVATGESTYEKEKEAGALIG